MRKIVSYVLSFLMICSILTFGVYAQESPWDGGMAASFSGGSGTEVEPYLITSGTELAYLASQVNTGTNYSGKYFKMTANINLGSAAWTPIGGGADLTNTFSGIFDGGEYYIENLQIDSSDPYCGLFGAVAGATIKNLGIRSGSVIVNCGTSSPGTAALVGYATISGLVMENCYNMASVTVTCNSAVQVGGILGQAPKSTPLSFVDCFNAGKVTVSGGDSNGIRVGGVVGYVAATSDSTPQKMIRCANMADIEIVTGGSTKINNARLGNIAGGFIGNNMTVTDCFGSGEMIVDWSNEFTPAKGLLFGYLNVAPVLWENNQAVPYDGVNVATGVDLPCSTTNLTYQPATTFISNLFTTVSSFQIRLTDNLTDSGIRVVSNIYNLIGIEPVSYGTIITPTDVVHKAYNDDFSNVPLSACLVIPSTKSVTESDGSKTIRAAMVQIHSYNYTRDFAAVSYIQYTVNGTEFYVYSTYIANTQNTCIYDMASALIDGGQSSAVLNAYAIVDNTQQKNQIYIVLPISSSQKLTESTNDLADHIKLLSGITPKVIKDTDISDLEKNNSSILYFLIGPTNFDETSLVYANLMYGSQTVTVKNEHIVVGGWYDETTISAVTSCKKILDKYFINGFFSLPSNLTQIVQIEKTLDALPIYPNEYPTWMYDCGDNCLMLMLKSDEKGYSNYLTLLIEAGYRAYTNNQIENIKYDTYENGTNVINLIHYTSTGEVRLLVEPLSRTGLPDKDVANYTYRNQTTITQFGLHDNTDDYLAGISYAIQLQDGSFILIDGGYYRDADADQLYNYMREHTPSGEPIVIAAWVITHGHIDHIGCFIKFTEKYSDKVTVERFILNDPSSSQRNITGDGPYYQKNKTYMQKYPGAIIYKAHPGQKYMIRNSVIEIYYTQELYAPYDLTYYNDCSIIFSITAENKKTMFLGDISEYTAPFIASLYKTSLDCDILQIAHHGFAGTRPSDYVKLNEYLAPDYVLWPSAQIVYDTRIKYTHVKPLINSAKQIFVAGNLNSCTTLILNKNGTVTLK